MTIACRFKFTRPGFELDIEEELSAQGVTAIVGPSGSGKTTFLRCLAGLTRAPLGRLRVKGEVWQDEQRFIPPHRRPVGYVFQEARLFPHLSVRGNLRFGQKRTAEADRSVSFAQAVRLLGIDSLLDRKPAGLSGGERKRVAIARALLSGPKLLLMDEPLAGLDPAARARILTHLAELQGTLAIPIVYVTHFPQEVVRLADQVLLIEAGAAVARGPMREMVVRPDLSLSHGEDAGAVLDAVVTEHDPAYHLTFMSVAGGRLAISRREVAEGQTMRIQIKARDVSLSLSRPAPSSIMNVLTARVLDVHWDGDPAHRLVRLDLDGAVLLARVTHYSVEQLRIEPGMPVFAQVKAVALVEE